MVDKNMIMVKNYEYRNIYVVISQTGSIVSKIIKIFTGDKYNHVSLSLDRELKNMYSFGRVNPYNPVIGGFVRESPNDGTMKRFTNTDAAVVELTVSSDVYEQIESKLQSMYAHREEYHYNYIGLFMAMFGRTRKKSKCYYCSEFIYSVLHRYNVNLYSVGEIIKPMDFLSIIDGRIIFEGKLRDYNKRVFRPLLKAYTYS